MSELLEQIREENGEKGAYIRDDLDAERALKRIAALQKERAYYTETYTKRLQGIQERIDADIENINIILREYFGRVPHKKTKTAETYQLANGKISVKRQDPEYKFDQPQLVAWLKRNASGYVKTEEKADWSNLKKLTAVDGETVVFAETGECIPGITAEKREDKFVVSVKEDET